VADLGEFGRELADLDDEVDVFTFHGEFFALPARMSALPLLRFAWRGKVLEQRVAQAKSARARAQTDEDRLAADQAEGTADPVPALPERSLRDQQRAAYLQGMRPVGASPR
jgi:hypothetical protein